MKPTFVRDAARCQPTGARDNRWGPTKCGYEDPKHTKNLKGLVVCFVAFGRSWQNLYDSAARRADRADAVRIRDAAELGGDHGLCRAESGGAAATAAGALSGRAQGPAAAAGGHHQ